MVQSGHKVSNKREPVGFAIALVLDREAASDAERRALEALAAHLFARGAASLTLIGAGAIDTARCRVPAGSQLKLLPSGGGQAMVLEVARTYAAAHTQRTVDVAEFDQAMREIAGPAPDLIIVTGSKTTLRGSLTWSAAYAEFVFTGKPWNVMTERDLDLAIDEFASRNRRFGGRVEVSHQ